MKFIQKRVFSALLALTLLLSLMPVALALVPMTMVQQTIGDPGKEFVYYIKASDIELDVDSIPNIETITVTDYYCNCGEVFFGLNPGDVARRYEHMNPLNPNACPGRGIYDKHNVYKITLKNGEKIALNLTSAISLSIYTMREDDYSLSYLLGDKETSISQNGSLVGFGFVPSTNGTITIKRSDGSYTEDTSATGTSFPDVDSGSDYAAAVEYVSKAGVMVGDDQGNFNPDKIVSRAEMATIVCRVLKQTANLPTSDVFTDVPITHWANAYIGKASELNVVSGYGDGRFGPSDPVTYEQAVTMIVRTIGEGDKASSYGGYPDGFLQVAQERNLLKGIQAARGQGLSRSSVAVLLYNYYTAVPEDSHVHNWATCHIDEVGHYESTGTHTVLINWCNCGAVFVSSDPDFEAKWNAHNDPYGDTWDHFAMKSPQ